MLPALNFRVCSREIRGLVAGLRPKDIQDFTACLPLLTQAQNQWLCRSIKVAYGKERQWLPHLSNANLPTGKVNEKWLLKRSFSMSAKP
jgi:hypothetical protein